MTAWSDIITAAMQIIDDERWVKQLEVDPAQFYRAKSQMIKLAMPLLNRPPELHQYLEKGAVEALFDNDVWISTMESTASTTVVETGKIGYEICCVVQKSDDGRELIRYTDFSYDPTSGDVTFGKQMRNGIEYEIDFYKDGKFADITPTQMRLFALAVAVVWDEHFTRNWLNMQMKIKDSSFNTVNEANYMEKANTRLISNRQAFNEELRKYEQDCAYTNHVIGYGTQKLV